MGIDRIVFFSDAVIAIAITLLAIDVRLPEIATGAGDSSIASALGEAVPASFAFALSFTVIAAYWVGHFRTFRVVVHVNGRLIGLNLLFLFLIAALPFPTSVLAHHGDRAAAVAFYALFGFLVGTVSTLLWVYPARVGLLAPSVTPWVARNVTYRALVAPLIFGITVPLAFVVPTLCWIGWVLIFPAQTLASRLFPVPGMLDAYRTGAGTVPMDDDPRTT